MLALLSLLLFSPLRCSPMQSMIDSPTSNSHHLNFLLSPQQSSPRLIAQNRFHQSNNNQPISIRSDSCKGIFPWTCVCQPEVTDPISMSDPELETRLTHQGTLPVESVNCENSRFTDTDVLMGLQLFPNVRYATFSGNNFLEFGQRILGPNGKHKSLLYLNLSDNNLLYLNQDAFIGLPSLQSLDLSKNALNLRPSTSDTLFLRPLRFLRRLLLRRAFRSLSNATAQLNLFERSLRQARLKDLEFLDLSENEFDDFPTSLVCYTPGLTHLILASNRLRTLHFDKRCPIELKALDLRWNRFKYFDHTFTRAARFFGPISVQVADNRFDCTSSTCESFTSVTWFRLTNVIKDKDTVRCQASERTNDDDYKADNYLLYAPLKPGIYCPERQASASQERDTTSDPFSMDEIPPKFNPDPTSLTQVQTGSTKNEQKNHAIENDPAIVLLDLGADNETFANNSAIALTPFRFFSQSKVKNIFSNNPSSSIFFFNANIFAELIDYFVSVILSIEIFIIALFAIFLKSFVLPC